MAVDLATLLSGHSGTITIPSEGATLTTSETIDSDLVIDGSNGVLTISGQGELSVEASLEYFGGTIIWNRTATLQDSIGAFRIKTGGGLNLHDVDISLDITVSGVNAYNPAPARFIRAEVTTGGGDLFITNNKITSERFYTVGFLYGDVAGFNTVELIGNSISQTVSAFAIIGGTHVIIRNNLLVRVTDGAIVTSGVSNYLIEGNTIIHPGWGGPGDGMTLIGGSGGQIRSNSIVHGSCYGIQMLPLAGQGAVEDTVIEGNLIANGATSAIYISGYDSTDKFDGMLIRANSLVSNRGRGLYSKYAVDITVEDTVFQDNAVGLPQHFFDVGSQYERWAYNKIGVMYSSSWTAGSYQPPYTTYAWPGYS